MAAIDCPLVNPKAITTGEMVSLPPKRFLSIIVQGHGPESWLPPHWDDRVATSLV